MQVEPPCIQMLSHKKYTKPFIHKCYAVYFRLSISFSITLCCNFIIVTLNIGPRLRKKSIVRPRFEPEKKNSDVIYTASFYGDQIPQNLIEFYLEYLKIERR